jgi:hypothetical protein
VVSAWRNSLKEHRVATRPLVQRLCVLVLSLAVVTPAAAQARRPASPPPAQRNTLGVRGFGMFGNVTFTATESFDAVLDRDSGIIYGGGGQLLLPWADLFVEVGAWRFKGEGQRVLIGANDQLFRLDETLEITVTPIEITGGVRFPRVTRSRKFVPYGGVGYSSYRYQETSEFAQDDENVDERFGGFHLLGGGEYQITRWLAVGGEVAWSTVADAIGEGGVSAHFNEDNLGGTSIRLRVSVGR